MPIVWGVHFVMNIRTHYSKNKMQIRGEGIIQMKNRLNLGSCQDHQFCVASERKLIILTAYSLCKSKPDQ